MASSFSSFSIISFLLLHSFFVPTKGFKQPLIHRFSLPEFSEEKFADVVEKNLKHYTDAEKMSGATPMVEFSTAKAIYFVNVTVGDPPIQQYLQLDTASSFTWLGVPQSGPYHYIPDTSKTFRYLSCGDPLCSSNPHLFSCQGAKINRCAFTMEYVDHSGSSGVVGYDQFGFAKYKDPQSRFTLENIFFGAATQIKGNFGTSPEYCGLMGIGPDTTSLLHQLPIPAMFSYSVGNVQDPNETPSYIYFGHDPSIDHLPRIPMIKDPNFYTVEISYISLSDYCIAIDPSVFRKVPGNPYSGVVIDTGAIMSFLPDVAFDVFEQIISEMMESKNRSRYVDPDLKKLCYAGILNDLDVKSYPLLSFHFVGGPAKMINTVKEYFYQTRPEVYCLSFFRYSKFGKEYENSTVLGLQSQQYHILSFDLVNWTLGILR